MIYFLAPAFNEESNLEKLAGTIDKLIKKSYRLIIVNDGSTDKTFQSAKRLQRNYPVIPLGYAKNRGPGHAFKFGIDYFLKKATQKDMLITIEADNTSDLSVVPKMINLTQKYDVIVASPFEKGGGFISVSATRKILSHGYQIFLGIIFGINGASSYGNFFRAYRTDILQKAKRHFGKELISETGFSSAAELLIKMDRIGAKITSVPVKIDWTKRQGKSKMKIFEYIKRQVIFVFKYKLLSSYFLK